MLFNLFRRPGRTALAPRFFLYCEEIEQRVDLDATHASILAYAKNAIRENPYNAYNSVFKQLFQYAEDLCVICAVGLAKMVAKRAHVDFLSDAEIADCYLGSLFAFMVQFRSENDWNDLFDYLMYGDRGFCKNLECSDLFALSDKEHDDIAIDGLGVYADYFAHSGEKRLSAYDLLFSQVLSVRRQGGSNPYNQYKSRRAEDPADLAFIGSLAGGYSSQIEPHWLAWKNLVFDICEYEGDVNEDVEWEWWDKTRK